MKWKLQKIGEIADIIDGDRGKNYPKQNEFRDKGYCLFLNTGNVTRQGFNFYNNLFITEEKDKILRKGKLMRGDIVFTSRGTIGNTAYYSDKIPYDNVRINSGMVILRAIQGKVEQRYLYQLLKSDYQRVRMQSYITGSAQPQLPIKNFSQIEIPIPPLPTQRRIADILSAYDDLIENNQKQIKLLEEAAMRLYKEWFVKLRFPGHENTKIVDGVPEGWSLKKLIDIADITMGQSPKSEYYNDRQQGLPFHQGVTNYGYRFVIDETYSTSYTRIAEAGSILFSVRAPVGRINITKNKIVIGRGLAAINHREGLQSFLFYMLKNRFYKDDLIGNGAIYASITKSALHSQEFLIPSDNLANKFNSVAKSIDQQITNADQQIILLKQARDRLLPRLLSGEIEV
jgi:type I restriction enzyme S subunit